MRPQGADAGAGEGDDQVTYYPPNSRIGREAGIARGSNRLRRDGKKARNWAKVRRQLKCQFVGMGVTTCELQLPGCMRDNGLGFAHALKRRHITTDEDMRRVALLCNNCHDVLELQGEAKMSRVIDSLIAKRAT